MKKRLINYAIIVFLFFQNVFCQVTITGGIAMTVNNAALGNPCGTQLLVTGDMGINDYYPITITSSSPVTQMNIPASTIGEGAIEQHRFDVVSVSDEVVSVSPSCSSLLNVFGNVVKNLSSSTSVATLITVTSITPFTQLKISRVVNNGLIVGPSSKITTLLSPISTRPDSGAIAFGENGVAVNNVILNDYVNSSLANFSNASLSLVSTSHPNISLNLSNGNVNVLSGIPVGTYNLVYRICLLSNPLICKNEVVTIKINPAVISACWKNIAITNGNTAAISSDGTLWTWGMGGKGLGDGTTIDRNVPLQVGTANNWKSVHSNDDQTFYALKTDGTLWAWGYAIRGFSTAVTASSFPIQIGTDYDWANVSVGDSFIVCLKNNGTIWSAGRYHTANQDVIISYLLTQVGSGNDWTQISAGYNHSLGIKSNGTMWSWKANVLPTQIGFDTDWKICSAGYRFSCAIKTNGTLWGWGINNYGQFGVGTVYDIGETTSPSQIGTSSNWKKVYCSGSIFGIKNDNSLWSWGYNQSGNLGNGNSFDNYYVTEVGGIDWEDIYIGFYGTIAKKISGSCYATGNNTKGQFGNFTYSSSNFFVPISNCDTNPNVVAVNDTANTIFSVSSTPINNVRANDTYNGTLATVSNTVLSFVSSTNSGITLNTSTGAISVSATIPVGTYTLTYQICAVSNPANCSTGIVTINVLPKIDAVNDSAGTSVGVNTTPVSNVLSNDTYNNTAATTTNVSLSFVSSTNSGITLNTTTGAVSVASSVLVGSYTLTYSICAIGGATNCDTATVSIVVSIPIDAVDDNASSTFGFSTTPISNVRVNDTYNNIAATSANTTLSLVSTTNSGINLNTITGAITVSSTVPEGVYYLIYRLCQTGSTTNCDTAQVTINVFPPTPESVVGIRANNYVEHIGIQTNGKIVIAGIFTTYNSISSINIARLNTNLTLDTSFLATGPTPVGVTIQDMLIQPDDKILLVGLSNMTGFNGGSNGNGIVRLNANGTVDSSFNIGGTGLNFSNRKITACALQSDGKILIGGSWLNSYNGVMTKNMIRLNSDGSIDNTFNFPYMPYDLTTSTNAAPISKIVIQPNGKILVGGTKSSITNGQMNIFRLNSDGSLDTSFALGNAGINESAIYCTSCLTVIEDIVLQPDNKVIVGGVFSSYNGVTAKNIIRLNGDGSIDTSFNPGTSTNRVINSVELDPLTNKIYIGGEFTTFNGLAVKKIIRLNPNGSIDNTFSSGTGTSHTNTTSFTYNKIHKIKRQSDGKIILGGNFTSYNGISATNITRILPSVAGGQGKSSSVLWISEPEIDINLIDKLVIYPNPSKDVFYIDLSLDENNFEEIEVYNILGELILEEKVIDKLNKINLENYPNGCYLVKISNDNVSQIKKIIKN